MAVKPSHLSDQLGRTARLVTRSGTAVNLREELGREGEGAIFRTEKPGYVAKVYQRDHADTSRRRKLEAMLAHPLDRAHPTSRGICWPLAILFDSQDRFRGYVMQEAKGRPMGRRLFVKTELQASFPTWDRRQLVNACITTLERIQFLHRANVLLGDINPENILVENESSVWLVDTDSYQIGQFPCPVGTAHFTPPELQDAHFGHVLRTPQHEAFAVATLVFMVLHLGKPPYAQRGGGSPIENIRTMEFPYPLGGRSRRNAPEGAWRFIWSNLTYALKEAFFETFDKSCRGEPRRTASDWLSLLHQYAHALDRGHVSRELFPASFKPVTRHAQDKFGAASDESGRSLMCAACGAPFVLSQREEDFFRSKGLSDPKRCKSCRSSNAPQPKHVIPPITQRQAQGRSGGGLHVPAPVPLRSISPSKAVKCAKKRAVGRPVRARTITSPTGQGDVVERFLQFLSRLFS